MGNMRFNTIAGWALAALVLLLGVSILSSEIFHIEAPEKSSYIVEGVVEEQVAAAPAEAAKPVAFYLASASADKGEAVFKKCAACHNAEKGGAAGIGPNLYGVVGAPHASKAGFAYSDVLAGKKGEAWSFDNLNAWLTSPKAYAAGNKMSFAGIGKPEDRAAVIAYLNSKSDTPLPMPAVPADATPAADAPATPATAAPAAAPAVAAPAASAPAAAAPAPTPTA